MIIKIRTCPINTRAPSSMRAALNSKYCMRAQLLARNLANGKNTSEVCECTPARWREKFFTYQVGQHRIKRGQHQVVPLHLPEEVKITKTLNGKQWSTSSMDVELAGDILEVRDGLGKIVDALLLEPKV